MATKSSFKQPCPSCEAMVPIRDPKLIGRKIDCPKCKYRFVVEEPEDEVDDVEEVEDEAPKKGKSKATAVTNKKPANGKATKPTQRRPDDDEDEEEAAPKKKKSGGSPMLIIGIGLAAVAVVALAVGAVFLFSGDKADSPKSSGGPSASMPTPNTGAAGETKQTASKEEPPAPKPRQEDVTNLLPNDTTAVFNLPMQQLFANPRIKQALLNTPGAFSEAAFQSVWGVPPGEVQRVVLAYNTEKKTVFSVMRTKAALKEEQIVAALKLKPEKPVGSAKYYLLTRPLDALSMFLLHDAMRLMLLGSMGPRDKVALHFIDPFTVVCAHAGPMNKFLEEKGQPKHLTKTPEEEAASKAPAAPNGPGGMPMPGGPGGSSMPMPGGPGGSSMPKPGGPGGSSMPGPGGPGGSSMPMPGGPGGSSMPKPGGSGGTGTPAPGGPGGSSMPTPAGMPPPGSPSSTSKSGGGYQPPSGMPPGGNMPPGMYPGRGGSPSDAAPASSSYLTIEPHLKAVLDQIEKVDSQDGQALLASFALNTDSLGSMESFLKTGITLLRESAPRSTAVLLKLGLGLAPDYTKAVGLAVTQLNDTRLDVNAALVSKDAKQPKSWESNVNQAHDDISQLLATKFGLDLVAQNAGPTNNSGMPGGGPPGMMGPGGFPMPAAGGPGGSSMPRPGGSGGTTMPAPGGPGGSSMPRPGGNGGFQPPNQFAPPGGGYGPGTQQPGSEKKEEKGKDGDYLVWTKDDVFAVGVHVKMNKERFKKGGDGLDFASIYLRGLSAAADRSSHIHELAAALQAYLEKEGHFPRGTVQRAPDTLHVLAWRPDQRLSWMTQIVPYLGNGEFQTLRLNREQSWYEDVGNAKSGFTLIPQFLAAGSSSPPWVPYPNIQARGPGLWAATHFVGVAGVGLDAAEYRGGDAATAKLCGVFGYDRETKKADIKDGPEQTIVALQVPPEPKSPWIAGGGSTVRGVSDDLECVRPFVCAKYPDKDGKEVDGTFAIMADGKVRFIPATIDPKTFQAMCTIAGEDKVSNLDAIAPEVPPPEDMQQQPELKTEAPPPPVVQAPAAGKSGLPTGWNEIVSKEGRYRVAVPPGQSKENTIKTPSPIGEIILHQMGVELPDNAGAFMVQYSDIPTKVDDAESFLKGAQAGIIGKVPGAQVTNEKQVTLAGRPGREFQALISGQASLLARIYLDNNRMYALVAAGPPNKIAAKDIQTFFDSFRLAK